MLSDRIGLALDNTEKPLRKLFDKWCAADATAFTAAEVSFARISPFARLRKCSKETFACAGEHDEPAGVVRKQLHNLLRVWTIVC